MGEGTEFQNKSSRDPMSTTSLSEFQQGFSRKSNTHSHYTKPTFQKYQSVETISKSQWFTTWTALLPNTLKGPIMTAHWLGILESYTMLRGWKPRTPQL